MPITGTLKSQVINRGKNIIWTTSLILVYIFGAIPLRFIYGTKIKRTNELKGLRRGTVFISNHQSRVDPFLILFSLSFWQYLKILPVRFPVASNQFNSRIQNPRFFPALTFLGCFSIGDTATEKMRTLFYIRHLLEHGTTMMIFPEGKRNHDVTVVEFQKGIDFFKDAAHSMVLVKITGLHKGATSDEDVTVTFSEVFSPPPSMSRHELSAYLDTLS